MNYLKNLLVAGALALTTATGFGADTFEGKVTWTMTSGKGKPMDMNYAIKGQKLRMDLNAEGGQPVSSIMDMQKLEMIMLMPSEKMYMVMPLKDTVQKASTKANANVDVEVTGRTEKILGYTCKELLIKEKKDVTEVWVAEGLGVFMGLNNNSGGGNPFGGGKNSAAAAKWEEVVREHGGFPLRVVTRDSKKKESFKMEATKIEPGKLADSLFTPPAGYEKFEMPNMGNLLKGFGG